ncbi:DUF3617 domain-containing protein [Methylobacterium dankookense]|uniref:DUF3617 family protein n=1 Tax=Methylobacterium dankookense TaxID=560405 RepID=A0A564FX73_9HYPH|nr:DUF3617 family protein [Methylobacterium dankookense]GJD54411.1 hypothetical protein IFDJLNFL_0282 [Methylobacterium dankookense]VUF12789.1 hypothetical protein MTDSW087_02484 [Methylobacterium dankookense]
MPARFIGVGIATALSAMTTLAVADTLPARKAGLWESKTVSAEGNTTARQCIDEKTDQLAQGAFGASQNCSKRNLVKTSTGYKGETECKIGPISAAGTSLITGDFSSKIHMEVDTTLTGIPNAKEPVRRQMVIDATYIGPCEAGQSPGDIIMPDGKIVKMPQTAPR